MEQHCRTPSLSIREATDEDSPAVIELVGSVLAEYGDQICLTGSEADLRTIRDSYFGQGGAMVVLLDDGLVIGCHAVMPIQDRHDVCTFRRLFLNKRYRGSVASRMLMDWAIDQAILSGYQRVEFWSDSRFHRAHRFFEKYGFSPTGEERVMLDSFEPYQELKFARDIQAH